MRPKELMKNLYWSIPDSCPAATCRTQEFRKKQHIKGGDFKIYQTDFSTWGVPILLLLSKRRRRKNTFVKERIRRMWSVSQKIFFGPVYGQFFCSMSLWSKHRVYEDPGRAL
ncbi:hypothetical protein PGT21_001772 [Puccinia graminis f. sp. tritici]|uniref:Uncharacterized protein n=1 Tax=Puccinia graminis f. sp. tritici TaxID=56615 RepID=A0A5B0RZH4_PUCGR|nr:hypothetical protein PGT21_001772 [Puccinia graminis f. sp. tritici]KAA1130004.1 hypothetical protein PGTUg99_010749 [Puccinia graminis f. sp. tritici]